MNEQDSAADKLANRQAGLASQANGCFVCGPANPIGLKIRFRLEQDICRGEFTASTQHAGYNNVAHGGIVFSLLDDVMGNWLWLQGDQSFTAKAEIRYRNELPIGVPVLVEGWCDKRKGRLAMMASRIVGSHDGAVYAEATASFMLNKTSNRQSDG